ncbi:MAG: CHAD domain-containing protein [Balneolaceae bacterium]|nr:CHAD domain-containing protein [Balneolaceae bacterium]MDR9408091.1 CHAD domain-containing protein [Balneolaceae bacterium]
MISKIETKSSSILSIELLSIFKNTKQEIIQWAGDAPDQIVESVHLIRKRLKFLRAFVKLTQFCSNEHKYKPVNYILRDAGRTISDCRDAHVRGLLLAEFSENELINNLVDELAGINDSVTRGIETNLLSGRSVFDEIISEISSEELNNYFESLDPDANCLIDGLALGYKKSYHAYHSELKSHEANLLHEWRKRTKDLQYQLEALLSSFPDQIPLTYEDVCELCEKLGRINDLFMFLEWLDSIEDSVEEKIQIAELKNILKQELNSLEEQADTMGSSLFSLNPEDFSESLNDQLEL